MRTKLIWTFLTTLCLLTIGCGGSDRKARTEQDLLQLRKDRDELVAGGMAVAFDRIVEVAKAEQDKHLADPSNPAPALDVLVISGGGDWGAFGAGVLKGWGKLPATNPAARPTFDVVTGVSTGALIAPFAFIGDEASIDQINRLYREPQSDWVETRGWFYFMPTNISFAAIPGLERDLRKTVDATMVRKLAETSKDGRLLAVNTTTLDDGGSLVFDLVHEARAATQSGNLDRIHDIMLASAGIPGVFPFRLIDGEMLVDGGVTGNIIYGGRLADKDTLPMVWKRKFPNAPMPRIRYWVIFNNQLRAGPKFVEPRWPAVVSRSLELSVRYATLTSIRHLLEQARYQRLATGAEVEVRILAIPNDWKPVNAHPFDKQTMNDLADLGERLGADPNSWLSEISWR